MIICQDNNRKHINRRNLYQAGLRYWKTAEKVTLSEVEIPEVRQGWVLVKVKAFGMNHSEQILRLNEIENEYIQKPIIPGIECAGEIVHLFEYK